LIEDGDSNLNKISRSPDCHASQHSVDKRRHKNSESSEMVSWIIAVTATIKPFPAHCVLILFSFLRKESRLVTSAFCPCVYLCAPLPF
jgi:ABC-type nickel/cobalt efflux system permease component RcnA